MEPTKKCSWWTSRGPYIHRRVKKTPQTNPHDRLHQFFQGGKQANRLQHTHSLEVSVASEIFFQTRDVKK